MSDKNKNEQDGLLFEDLLQPGKSIKPVAGGFATAAQLVAQLPFLAVAGVDETFLRNRGNDLNPRTGQPFVPKCKNRMFEVTPTILGLLEWFALKAAERDGLPASFDSMQAMENSFLSMPKEFTKWALKNGAAAAQLGGSRIDPRPVLAKGAEILKLVPTGRITGIGGLEEWDTQTELAQKLRQERLKLEDEALIRRGEQLLSRDGTFAVTELVADELIWEKTLSPVRAAWTSAPKIINRQHKTILKGEGSTDEKINKCAAVVTNTVANALEKLRAKIPAKKLTTEKSEA